MTSVAIVTPSRGLVHSRTIEAIMGNAAGHEVRGWFLTHDLPIPDCHERVAELGLASGADALWFVEEDVIPPVGALAASLHLLAEADAAAVDYPVGSIFEEWGCAMRADSEILWAGFGATLIRSSVFARLERPWFRTDQRYLRTDGGWQAVVVSEPEERRWGQHDIAFFSRFREAGLRLEMVEGMTAGHARLVELGKPGSNVGYHRIEVRERISAVYPGVTV